MKLSRLVPQRRSPALLLSAVSACAMALIVACAGELPPELKPGGGNDTGGAPANTGGSNTSTGGMSGGTGGMATGTGGSTLQNCAMATKIITDNCTVCHSKATASAFANLDLASDGVGSRLVGVAADTGGTAMCQGKGNLIDPGSNPATGLLIDKINNKQTCGTVMPSTTGKMSAANIACLTQWATYLAAGNN